MTADMTDTAATAGTAVAPGREAPPTTDEPTIEVPHAFDAHQPPPVDPGARAARHRVAALLTDTQRAMFLQQWNAVQTGFVTGPDATADAAERLIDDLARRIVRNIGMVRDQAMRPVGGTAPAQAPGDGAEAATERDRVRLLQCREAFSLLIDS